MRINFILSFVFLLILGCTPSDQTEENPDSPESVTQASDAGPLPFLGIKKRVGDSLWHHTIPEFAFINQDSIEVTHETFSDKVYLSDFFFTSCPSICPEMKRNMSVIAEHFADIPDFKILSHSIDPKRDSVPVLKRFSDNMEMNSEQWHLVTGDKEEILDHAQFYLVSALEDDNAPGGYVHDGRFLLVDGQRRIRGAYDGTDSENIPRIIRDVEKLIKSQNLEGGE